MSSDNIAPSQDNDDTARSTQNEHEAIATRKSTMYELFVLGELMDGPQHGYFLREILSRMLGPFRQISWGVLYPLIRQLEREGLIVQDEESSAASGAGTSNSKQRKSYRITERGRKRFYALMQEQGEYTADYSEYFIIKLNNFDPVIRLFLSTSFRISCARSVIVCVLSRQKSRGLSRKLPGWKMNRKTGNSPGCAKACTAS
jgi:DNA-binding PadR family transcriptional regulator